MMCPAPQEDPVSPSSLFSAILLSSIALGTQSLPAETNPAATNASRKTTPSVAHVYVSSSATTGYQITAYDADYTGALTQVSGSPFPTNGFYLGGDANWLFATDTIDIYSYAIASNGAPTQLSSVNAQQYNSYPTGGPIFLFFDRTAGVLYDEDIYADGANSSYQFFNLDRQTGALSYLGQTAQLSADWGTPLSFTGNKAFGYGATCYRTQFIYGFHRNPDASLTDLNITPNLPIPPSGGYCPYLAAADRANHIAIPLAPADAGTITGPYQLSVYTADDAGDLTTTSTFENMPRVAVGSLTDLKADPNGKLLAVAGATGVQVFHFNGAHPIKHYTPLLTTDPVDQIFWDSSNHLYGISSSANKLYVFTVTETKYRQAPGSPYSFSGPISLAVVGK